MTTLRTFVVVVALVALAPAQASAQAPKAGVVTTLEGNVTATRAAAPPVPLRFKDDIFIQDKITTGEQSLARMLLGGKAVVTVRERSVLTVTEIPGRSTIEIDSGKFALAVARERMRPGEVIEIRTPNAVAGVRGSVVVTEVESPVGAPTPVSSLSVIRGDLSYAQPRDPATRAVVGTSRTVNAMEQFRVVGLLASLSLIRPEQLPAIRSGLQPKDKQHTQPQGQEDVKARQMEGAAGLATAVNGGTTGPTTSTPSTDQKSSTAAPINPVTKTDPSKELNVDSGIGGLLLNGGFETGNFNGWTIDGAGLVISSFGPITAPEGKFMALIHTNTGVVLAGCASGNDCTRTTLSQKFKVNSIVTAKGLGSFLSNEFPTFTGPSAVFKDRYLVRITDATGAVFTLLDITVADLHSLFTPASSTFSAGTFTLSAGRGIAGFDLGKKTVVIASGVATLSITVSNVSDSGVHSAFLLDAIAITQDPPLHFIQNGSFNADTLLSLNNESRSFDSLLFVCCGGRASLRGPALQATNSTLEVPFSLISTIQGGTLTSEWGGPLVQLDQGSYTLGAAIGVFEVAGVNDGDRPLRHNGVFLDAHRASVSAGAAMVVDTALLEATAPLLNLRNNSAMVTADHALDLQRKASVTSTGPLFALDRSALTVRNGALVNVAGGSILRVNGNLIHLSNGSVLNLLNGPLAQVTGNSLFSVGGALFAFSGSGNIVKISNGLCATFGCTTIGGLPVAFTGGATAANVSIKNAVSGAGAMDIAGAALLISGPGSKVTIGN